MGYMRHHAIVVTSWHTGLLHAAHDEAIRLGMSVTDITDPVINGYRSFLVAPDGSKEGWPQSDLGDTRRTAFMEWLDDHRFEDDSTALGWCEVQFADDELHSAITRDSDQPIRNRYAAESDRVR